LGPEGGDAALYGLSALFAVLTGVFAGLPSYRVWAWIALGPYAAAALVSLAIARHAARRGARLEAAGEPGEPGRPAARGAHWGPARVWVLMLVLLGATLVPLSVEVSLTRPGVATSHVQPEVIVIAQAGERLSQGKDVYHATVDRGGHVDSAVPGEPAYDSFFPYLPLMAAFGLPGKGPVRVTDTRVLFSLVTLLVVGLALSLLRAPRDRKMRALQFLTVLPSAALPLATGGDDMPIVAFLLLAMVLAQRRRPGWSGLVFGVVSSMKLPAWPLAALALFAARDERGRRTPGRMLAGMLVVASPVVVPFAVSNLRAFFQNVVLFPLGLSGISSPAASNLPGHVLVHAFPSLHAALPVLVALVGGALMLRRLVRRTPSEPADVAMLAGWAMLVAIAFAPATRVGYLLYPADFFVWGWMLRAASSTGMPAPDLDGRPEPVAAGSGAAALVPSRAVRGRQAESSTS
jgi:hypothetical protein